MLPPPSRNATGLAAYGQLARNLAETKPWSVPGYRYRHSHDNPTRLAMWLKRRRAAASYVAWLARVQPDVHRADLRLAADALGREVADGLVPLAALYPEGQDPAAATEPARIRDAGALLRKAEAQHRSAIEAVFRVVASDLKLSSALAKGLLDSGAKVGSRDRAAFLKALDHPRAGIRMLAALRLGDGTPDDAVVAGLVRRVDDPHMHVAEAALASLVRLAPEDLATKLAGLMTGCGRESRREMADGPIQRHLLYALGDLPGDEATAAIAAAVLDDGALDDVPPAISRWAATLLRERLGDGAKPGLLRAFESDVPHVREVALFHLVDMEATEILPALESKSDPASLGARYRLGDEAALRPLIEALGSPDRSVRTTAVNTLAALGPRIEPALIARIEADGGLALLANCGYVLASVGTARSVPVLEGLAKREGVGPHAARALQMLKSRLAEED